MASSDHEEQQYQDEISALKQWWTDSRWRFTKRPYTAEQIVNKRGNLKIDYPSNALSKKLWKTVEERFAVSSLREKRLGWRKYVSNCSRRTRMLHTRTAVSIQSWSPKWPSTSIPSTSLAGRALPPLLPRTSRVLILQTTHTRRYRTRCNISSWHSSSTTASNGMSVSRRHHRKDQRLPTPISCVQSLQMLILDMAV